MAPHFELVDPAGHNYDLQSDYASNGNRLSQQVFDGRQPLWNDCTHGGHHQPVDADFRYDGSFARDGRFERVNDYSDPRSFDNPYNHLQNAHQTAQNFGPRAAMPEYQAAIDAADRIDQRQVSRDIQRNDRALMQNEETMDRAERSGASSRQMRELEMQHLRLEKQQQFLDSMRMAPVYARSNAAFCCISRGDEPMFRMGESLLNQAINMDPDIESNYYFNMHR
ncbi:MAG: hypothetical protein JST89_26645, partial [Cyanobacteria bacterium SZAS-4]|nr:hypothetical protein [Cyanobacteria bacterium SZAS-4]